MTSCIYLYFLFVPDCEYILLLLGGHKCTKSKHISTYFFSVFIMTVHDEFCCAIIDFIISQKCLSDL